MNPDHVREFVIRPVLLKLKLYSEAAEDLLLYTAAHESQFKALQQGGGGPAQGLYQMEPRTASDIWRNYLAYNNKLREEVLSFTFHALRINQQMQGNLCYATAMARIHYLRVSAPLPRAGDMEGYAAYWKEHYNTKLGKGTVDKFIADAKTYGGYSG